MTTVSKNEEIQNRIHDLVAGLNFSAPYGILVGKQNNKSGRSFRYVTFGRPRTLDATVCIYGPTFITVRTSRHQQQLFRNVGEVEQFIREL